MGTSGSTTTNGSTKLWAISHPASCLGPSIRLTSGMRLTPLPYLQQTKKGGGYRTWNWYPTHSWHPSQGHDDPAGHSLNPAPPLSKGWGPPQSYVSFFDVAPPVDALKIARNRYPEPSTEEYNVAFLEDMMRLLEDCDNLALIYKPQRSLVGPKFSYSEGFRGLLDRLESSGRGFILDDTINPWVPIEIADLCISMPFTPPSLAAMHYGIPGLFHDPTGMALRHRYQPISHFITHDYDELRSKVRTLLSNGSRYNRDKEIIWSEARSFIGDRPGINSSERFRNMLWKFHKKEDQT